MAKANKNEAPGVKLIARVKDLGLRWEVVESHEAGLVLQGTEVKSLRESRGAMKDCYCRFTGNELFVVGLHIPPYSHGTYANHDPDRPRKLLLHKRELVKLRSKVQERGLSIVPARMYFKQGKAKVEIVLARGKKLHDRREDLKRKTQNREMERAMRRHK